MWPSLWRRPVPCNSPGRDTLWTPPRRQRDPCVAARGTPHDATGSGCLPNVGYWPRLVTIAVLDLGGVLCQQREGPGVRAAGQSSPLTPTPPFQAPPPPPKLSCQPRSQATPAPPRLGPTHPSVRAPHATRACGVSTQGGGSLIFGGAAAGRRASVRGPRRACGGPRAGERPCTRPYIRSPAPCWLWTQR